MAMFLPKPKPSREERILFALLQEYVFIVRGKRVLLNTHLADLYGIAPRVLNQAVRRNIARFPADALFQINAREFSILKSRSVISKYNYIRRSLPYAFTEQGVVLLSGILRSKNAVAMNAAIVRFFTQAYRRPLRAREVSY